MKLTDTIFLIHVITSVLLYWKGIYYSAADETKAFMSKKIGTHLIYEAMMLTMMMIVEPKRSPLL